MANIYVDLLKTIFLYSELVPSEGGAPFVIDLFQRLGSRYYDRISFLPYSDSSISTNTKGSILAKVLAQHPLLLPDVTTLDAMSTGRLPSSSEGTATFSFLQGSRSVVFTQDASFHDQLKVDALAHAQLKFARMIYPYLLPKYGWIDEVAANLPTEERITATRLDYIFWANYFGPDYVSFLGRDFLLNAPGWRKEELEGGGILYVTCESYLDWWKTDHWNISDYFNSRFPEVELFWAEDKWP